MTPVQQQRLIGAALLVVLVIVIAYFLLSRVQQVQTTRTVTQEEAIPFSSLIEPVVELEPVAEALWIDPEAANDSEPLAGSSGIPEAAPSSEVTEQLARPAPVEETPAPAPAP
ncbi:hypothetical protein, partial [Methylophaga lonarensis]